MKDNNDFLNNYFQTMAKDLNYIYKPDMNDTPQELDEKDMIISKLKKKLDYRTSETIPIVQLQAVLIFLTQWDKGGAAKLLVDALKSDITIDRDHIAVQLEHMTFHEWSIKGFLLLRKDIQGMIIKHALACYPDDSELSPLNVKGIKDFYL